MQFHSVSPLLSLSMHAHTHTHTHTHTCTQTYTHLYSCIYTVHDELNNILDLVLSFLLLFTVLPRTRGSTPFAEDGLDRLETPVAHSMEEQDGLLADPCTTVMEDAERSTSLLHPERLRWKATCHHLTYDNLIQLIMGQVSPLTAHCLQVIHSAGDGQRARTVVGTKVTLAVISYKLLHKLLFCNILVDGDSHHIQLALSNF